MDTPALTGWRGEPGLLLRTLVEQGWPNGLDTPEGPVYAIPGLEGPPGLHLPRPGAA
jgi:hypothetical protein